ncbi:MAG: trehalose-phosphatase, partial [Cyclobacteriaceae bacterium]
VAKQFLDDEKYDFIMAVGDDKTDEDMFRALAEIGVTVKIGPGYTAAQYHLSNHIEVIHLLNQLNQLIN